MPEYRAIYEKRKETIERVFGDAKEKHGMRYTNSNVFSPLSNMFADSGFKYKY